MSPARTLTFSDGQSLTPTGYVVVGRKPSAERLDDQLDGSSDVDLVTVADDARSISRTHFVLGPYDDLFWVADAGSGNGTRLVYPDGSAFRLEPGTRYEVDPGSRITFGSFWVEVS
ncbi:FHA domain-containing protein [Frondihabitans australicus]|uniref:FHA domain-containing protein n=1 Tax=Frondihabitans australicus TaxID=386892 RepID=A0A495IE68_9MICO|nr:FHA domain-containing protein [Frondihabitans australicus]RKR73950.1 FHA domain-containing protein [Frondihabitans australicus]